jgi:type IV pilus assembly protein PilN
MTHINLLPWREAERARRQREFIAMLVAGLVVALGISFSVHLYIEDLIEIQNGRNTFLKNQIAQIERDIEEIEALEKTKNGLISRMQIIQELQQSRPEIVHLFDELASTIPEGIYLTKAVQQGRVITLEGRAQSHARVSAYMRNIDASAWLGDADLKIIDNKETRRAEAEHSQFVLVAKQIDRRKQEAEISGVSRR